MSDASQHADGSLPGIAPTIDPSRIAPMMRHLWSPVAAVTCCWEGRANAQIAVTVNAASVVPDRPRVVVQIYKVNHSWALIHRSGAFALNFLGSNQLDLLRSLGFRSGRDAAKLDGVPYHLGESGSPILEECWGYLDCRVVNAMDGGDMTVYLADVLAGDTTGEAQPLWWPDARRRIPDAWNAEWDEKAARQVEFSRQLLDKLESSRQIGPGNQQSPDQDRTTP